jgi:demethylmenaquinone methyltransferase/2-methoxy-6-polyprenyl-1,4-benzoquinol methylase
MKSGINSMFSKIYLKYDLMNHLMSFNFDKDWREDAANEVIIEKDKFNVLDVASGTGDLAIAINKAAQAKHKKVYIYAYDFNADMLDMARSKFRQEGMVKLCRCPDFGIRSKELRQCEGR